MLNSRKTAATSVFFAASFVLLAAAYSAYKGHANDKDVNAILSAYPTLKGTAADSCIACHRSGRVHDQFIAEEKPAISGALKSKKSK